MMFHIAAIQITPILGDIRANVKRGVHYLRKIAQDADVIVFPELWTTGYYLSKEVFHQLAETIHGLTITELQEEALRSNAVIISSFAEKDSEGRLFISAAIIDQKGELSGVVRKSLLWGRENEIFTMGEIKYPIIETEYAKLGVLICYEMEFPERSPLDPRALLEKVLKQAQDEFGFQFLTAPEHEFFLLTDDEYGKDIHTDNAGYFHADPRDKGEAVRKEIVAILKRCGIQFEKMQSELP